MSTPRPPVAARSSRAKSAVVVIEDLLRAERARALRFRGRRGRKDAGAEMSRELNRGLPDAAAAREHQHDVARRAGRARVTSMCHAVRNVSGNAAAVMKST